MSSDKPKVALAHEFLVQYGGAEKTFEAVAELFPDAPIYTAKYDPRFISKMSKALSNRRIVAPSKNVVNRASKYFFTFMMAPVFENMDFRNYDLVISDGNTWNKGILTKPDQLHITYVHTPPRFLYKYSTESTKRDKWYFKLPFSYIDNILRIWDYVAAQRPDYMLCNSQEVQKRIQKFYRRQATVIYPPVETHLIKTSEKENIARPYYVAVGRLIKYKNFDLVIQAFNLLGIPLVIVGTGNYEDYLKAISEPNIVFKGAVSDAEKHKIIANALGLINPVEDEDFGIVPVEAMSHGIPVLVHKSGGHKETVVEGENGMFFEDFNLESLVEKIKLFDAAIRNRHFNKNKIIESVKKYSKERFQQEFSRFVWEKWENFKRQSA